MMRYVILLRGINVGGKNKIPMADLKSCLENLGYDNVTTYIASGNVILESVESAESIQNSIEQTLIKEFKLDSDLIKVLALTQEQLQAVIDTKPKGFGDQPDMYHSDVIFLMGIDQTSAIAIFNPRQGVDVIWPGNGVIYSQRSSSQRIKSRLGKIVGTPPYKSMTIRSYNTVKKLGELLQSN